MKVIGKILLCAFIYVCGTVVTGIITTQLHIAVLAPFPGVTPERAFKYLVLLSPLLAIGVAPLAAGLAGRRNLRWLALGVLVYVALGVNTAIELTAFSSTLGKAYPALFVNYFLPCAVLTAALAFFFSSHQPLPSRQSMSVWQWTWRAVVAWLAFPIVYFMFGMCVAPFVTKYYLAGVAGLKIPAMSVILKTQAIRSALFLAVSLPVIRLWTGSRARLLLTLGLAHAILVGVFGLAQAFFLPAVLRVAHSIEITADSFAYAAVLVWLFAPKRRAIAPEHAAVMTAHAG
jgi:hypothetical protein